MLKRTEGIVLKSFPFGEADLIVTFLTRDFGLTRAFAKSPRKIKSRFGSALEPLTHSKISLRGKEDAALPLLTQSDIVTSFQTLREDYGCFLKLCGMLELSLNLLAEGEENLKAFDLLKGVLEQMQDDCSLIYTVYYKVRLIEISGYSPKLILEALRVTPSGKSLYETLRIWDIKKISRIKAAPGLLNELSSMLDAHIEYRLSKPLKVRISL